MTTNQEQGARPTILRAVITVPVAIFCGLASGFTVGVLCVALLSPNAPGTRDYIFYWATAQQLTHHANPYDQNAMTRIERAAGFPAAYKIGYMRNPPWALPLVYPLGFLSPRDGWILWVLLLFACLAGSVFMIWILYGRPRNSRYLLGLSFGPALLCLIYGQTSILALPGLVLFLRLHRTHPFLAGIALWLCTLKPHLFLPFGAVLVAWVLVSRCYKLVAGAATGLAAGSAIAYLIDPSVWTQYLQMARTSGIAQENIPCVSSLLRHWISPDSMSLQFLLVVLGTVWALCYFWPRRCAWEWTIHGGPLMLVSLLAAPYSWVYDQCLAIPALLQGAFLTRSRNLLIALAFLSALVEVALFRSISHPQALYLWTYWTAPAWLIWYLIAYLPSSSWTKRWSASKAVDKLADE